MNFRFSFFFLLLAPAISQAGVITLSLDKVAQYASNHHPQIKAARWRIEEARGRLQGAGRMSNPNVSAEFAPNIRGREGMAELAFEQSFPVTSRLRLEKTLGRYDIAIAEEEVRDQIRRLGAEAETAAVEWLALEAQVELRLKQRTLSQQLAQFATERSKAGELSPLDAGQAQMDAAQVSLELRQLESEKTSALNKLRLALGLAAKDTVKIQGTLPAPHVVKRSVTLVYRPDYRLAQLQQQAAAAQTDLAKAQRRQDWSAGLFGQSQRMEDAPDGLQNDHFVGLRISIPLPFWNRNQGPIAEAAARQQRVAAETKALQTTIENEVAAAQREMAAHARILEESNHTLLPLMEQQVERFQKAYESGQTDLLTLLRARDQKLRLQSSALVALREWHLARVRLRAAQGSPSSSTSSQP